MFLGMLFLFRMLYDNAIAARSASPPLLQDMAGHAPEAVDEALAHYERSYMPSRSFAQ